MLQIEITELDHNLIADIGEDLTGWEAFEADYPDETLSDHWYNITFNGTFQRGGIVLVGGGASGATYWTDAATAAEVLDRFLRDDMCN